MEGGGKTAIPTYRAVDISVKDYLKIEFGSADANYFNVRITFNSSEKGKYIQVRTTAFPNTVSDFCINQRLEDDSSQQAIRSAMGFIECELVNTSFKITVYSL
jgi:hypothetical protein